MTCYYQGYSYAEGSYVCMGADKYVCFENQWRVALLNAPECTGESGGWKVLKTIDVTLTPAESIVGGWKVLKTIDVTLTPAGGVAGGWKVLKTIDITLVPEGYVPECSVDADCPSGYKCIGGKCVKEDGEEKPFPWEWAVAGGLGVGALLLLAPGTKETETAKKK